MKKRSEEFWSASPMVADRITRVTQVLAESSMVDALAALQVIERLLKNMEHEDDWTPSDVA